VAFRKEPGEELPSLLFRLQGLAVDLEKPLKDKELVGKFVASLDRRLAEQTNTQAMASTVETGGAYSLEEAYDAALMVSAGNAWLKIARELAPRAAEVSRPRWGGKPAVAHAAVVPEVAQMVAAAPAATGGSGACHNCGEVGHYRSGCPYSRRNSSGGRNAGAGGRGGGRGRACYVCGEVGHLAAQCAKRVVPVAAAAAVQQGSPVVSQAEFAEFQAWRARTQAAAATRASPDSGEDSGGEWDDQEYEMGAVALPVEATQPKHPGLAMAAAGTKAGAEKARVTRAAKKGLQPLAAPRNPSRTAAGGQTGTAQIAGPVDQAALELLRGRRDKAAARERLVRLPDHGRNVAPQGLNRLPKSFAVGGGSGGGGLPKLVQQPGAAGVLRQESMTGAAGAAGRQGGSGSEGAHCPGGAWVPGRLPGESGPALTGGVTLDVLSFLELAGRAGLDLAAVTRMARGAQTASQGTPMVQPIRLPAEGASIARPAPAAPIVQGEAAAQGLSPIAVRAQEARGRQGLVSAGPAGPACEAGGKGEASDNSGIGAARTVSGRGPTNAKAWGAPKGAQERAESSAMGAARETVGSDEVWDRELVAQQHRAAAEIEKQVACISRDAELALQMVAQEAKARGISRAEALREQVVPPTGCGVGQGGISAADKGKRKELGSGPTVEEEQRVLSWERKLSTGAWSGADELAEVVVNPEADLVTTAAARAEALACFAESRPLVSPANRSKMEGVPDWVDNSGKVVRVMTAKGWWAPEKVLLDGGSYYSMAGARLKARLGPTEAEMDAASHKVQTAMGKVETLQGGLTKDAVPVVLNAGTADEVCLLEPLAFTDSIGYDLLIGTRAAYPCGLSVDRWTEQGVYRVDWQSGGERIGKLPMKLHQERPSEWVQVVRWGQRESKQAALACCLTN
jgi:hypothetical protein